MKKLILLLDRDSHISVVVMAILIALNGVLIGALPTYAATYAINCSGDAGTPTEVTEATYTSADDVTFRDTGGDGVCALDAALTADDVVVETGVSLVHTALDTDGVTITATTITVDAGGEINAEKRGCTSSQGPDASNACSSQATTTSDTTPPGGEGADTAPGWGTGAGHGGAGGVDVNSVAGGGAYDSVHYPSLFGSGGGQTGGKGGGLIRLVTTGAVTINGTVKATGGTAGSGGGGSGGSVYIYSGGTLSGSGIISSDGGNASAANHGRGGGGRVAVYYQAGTPTTLLSNATANAGTGTGLGGQKGSILFALDPDEDSSPSNNFASASETSDDEWTFAGGRFDLADTVDSSDDSTVALSLSKLTIQTTQTDSTIESDVTTINITVPTVVASQNGTISCSNTSTAALNWIGITSLTWADHDLTCPEIDWGVDTDMTFSGSATITANKKGDIDALTVNGNSSSNKRGLTLSNTAQWLGNVLYQNATSVTVNSGTAISATGYGCSATKGPDSSNACQSDGASLDGEGGTDAGGWGGGAGHGGNGGNGVNGSGRGTTYGSNTAPVLFGSGGGLAGGGQGSGYILITTSGNMAISGNITADGSTASSGGGGSGGSVYLQISGELSGTGNVTAKGGSSSGANHGAGGGGRISIYYVTLGAGQTVTSNLSVTAGTTGVAASAGTTNAVQYSVPSAPTISSPANGATSQSRTLTVTTSAYSGDAAHTTTSWQISDDNTFSDSDCSDTNIVGCHLTSSNKESIVVNSTNLTMQNGLSGKTQLAPNTTYYVRARHTNAAGSSTWSSSISFTTTTNVVPDTPTNSSPASSATGVSKNPTLQSSAFSNSDSDSHYSSDWAVYEASDCSGTADWSKTTDTSNLTSIVLNSTNGTFADALSGKTTLKAHTVYSYQVRYSDPYASGTSSYSSCTSFTTTNTAPALDSSIANQSLTEDTNVTSAFDLDTYFSDVDFNDDDAYTCTASNGLAASLGTMTINSNRTVDFTLTANANGTDTIQFSCADGNNESTSSNAVTVTIAAANDSPTLSSSISNQTTNEDTNLSSAFDLDSFFTDVDAGDSCTYSVVDDFSKGTMTISSGAVSFAVTANANGSDTVQFRCTDSSAATVDSNSVTITVTAVNDTPIFTGTISNQTTNEDTNLSSAFDLDNFFSDIDTGDSCTYSVVDDFSKGTMTISSGAVSFAVTANANGSDTVKFRCTDSSSATVDSNSVTVTVTAVNDAPSVSGPVNISIDEGTKLVILVAGADNDGDNLALIVEDTSNHYSTQGIAVSNLFTDAGDKSGVFEWTPQYDNNGSYATTFIANDGTTTGNTAITITVNDINSEPAFTDTLPTVAFVGGTTTDVVFDLNDYFTDADGDTLTYSVAGNDQVEAVITDGAVQLTAPASFGGTEALTFTATDAVGATENSNAVVVTVTPGLSLETVDHVEGTTSGAGTITVIDTEGNELQWTAFPVGGSVPRLAEINDAGYVFATKYRSGSTIHAYTLTGEIIKKKRLSPKLHWRKLATGDLDNDTATEEVVVATRRDSSIYFKVYAFKPNRAQFDLLYKARAGVGPITDDEFQVTIEDKLIVLKNSADKLVHRFRPL